MYLPDSLSVTREIFLTTDWRNRTKLKSLRSRKTSHWEGNNIYAVLQPGILNPCMIMKDSRQCSNEKHSIKGEDCIFLPCQCHKRQGLEVGGRFKREGTYVYLWLIHVAVWQKSTQYCKAIILQLKIKKIIFKDKKKTKVTIPDQRILRRNDNLIQYIISNLDSGLCGKRLHQGHYWDNWQSGW